MPSDITPYRTLMSIVALWLDEHSKQGLYDRDRIWNFGVRAVADMGRQFSSQTKTIRIPLNANRTANLPNDCLSWSKIGLQDSHGEISTLKINNALTFYADNSPQRIEKIEQVQVNDSISAINNGVIFSNYYYNDGMYNLFGYGGGLIQHGECRVDEANRIIIFPPDFRYESVLFEYLSAPEKDPDYMVQGCLTEPIIAFINAKTKLGTMQDYYAECVKARRHLKPVILQSINQVLRESESMKLRS